jgi:hypothetical protein
VLKIKRIYFIIKMYTRLFVDTGSPFRCGYQLARYNWFRAPQGKIRIARFENSFSPDEGRGYYGDIYLRQFIRLWKNKTVGKRRRLEKKMTVLCISTKRVLNEDVLRYIIEFL